MEELLKGPVTGKSQKTEKPLNKINKYKKFCRKYISVKILHKDISKQFMRIFNKFKRDVDTNEGQ